MSELLTDEELERLRELRDTTWVNCEPPSFWPPFVKLLRAYEALVQQVAELTAAHAGALGTLKCANDVSEEWERAYHTEKAARETEKQQYADFVVSVSGKLESEKAAREAAEALLKKHVPECMAYVTESVTEVATLRARVSEMQPLLGKQQSELEVLRAKLEKVKVALADSYGATDEWSSLWGAVTDAIK